MRRRDRQNELVVAVVVVGAMAMALAFGIILTLGSQNDGKETDATTHTATIPNTRAPMNVPTTDSISVINQTETALAITLTAVSGNISGSETTPAPTAIAQDESPEPSSTPTPTPTNSPEPSAIPSDTPQASDTPEIAPTPTATVTRRPSVEPRATTNPSSTSSATPSSSPSSTQTPTNARAANATKSLSASPTATSTNTRTSTATPTNTFTRTPSPTQTLRPSNTPTVTITPSSTRTPRPPVPPPATRRPTATRTLTITPFPSATITPTVLTATPTACIPPQDWVPYIVEIGDTLFEIARSVGLRTDVLREANCLTGSNIQAGQILYIPPNTSLANTTPGVPAAIGCDFPSVVITEPRPGQMFIRTFDVRGMADFPNFGRYELQIRPADGPPDVFTTLLQNPSPAPFEGVLGQIDPNRYPSGNYWVRLMIYSNQGYELSFCAIQITLSRP